GTATISPTAPAGSPTALLRDQITRAVKHARLVPLERPAPRGRIVASREPGLDRTHQRRRTLHTLWPCRGHRELEVLRLPLDPGAPELEVDVRGPGVASR